MLEQAHQNHRTSLLQFSEVDVVGLGAIEIPKALSGVYFLFKDDKVVYVGSSSQGTSRVGRHFANNVPDRRWPRSIIRVDKPPVFEVRTGLKVFDRAYFIPCKESDRLQLEEILIFLIQPVYNLSCRTFPIDHARNVLRYHKFPSRFSEFVIEQKLDGRPTLRRRKVS
jgi:excinuclease UvrABC nuclease subunit